MKFYLVILFVLFFTTVSFSETVKIDDFEGENLWNFGSQHGGMGNLSITDECSFSGKKSLKVVFDLSKDIGTGGPHVAFQRPVNLSSDAIAIRFRIKKTCDNQPVVRITDSEGQTFQRQITLPMMDWWQDVEVSYNNFSGHWGGANDGVFRGNPTSIGFAIDLAYCKDNKGIFYIDDIQMICGDKSNTPVLTNYIVSDFKGNTFKPLFIDGAVGELKGNVLSYSLKKSNSIVGIASDIELYGDVKHIKLKIDSDRDDISLSMKLGSHFTSFYRMFKGIKKGEQIIDIPCDKGMTGWQSEGGGFVDTLLAPLRILDIRFISEIPGDGNIILKEIDCESIVDEEKLVSIVPESKLIDNRAEFKVTVTNLLPTDINSELNLTVRDFSSDIVKIMKEKIKINARGATLSKTFVIPMKDYNFLEGIVSLPCNNRIYGNVSSTVVKSIEYKRSNGLNPISTSGMGVYLYRMGNPTDDYADMRRVARMAESAGIKWSREEFSWAAIEKSKGNFDWSFYDKLIDIANEYGISVYGLLCYWNNWTKADTEEGREDYYNFVRAVVSRYKDKINHWEIWNEPNIFFFPGPKENYVKMLIKSYEIIKEIDPDALVLGCSTAGIDRDFINMCIDNGAVFDVLTIHPYRVVLDDNAFRSELKEAVELTKRIDGNPRPVWITEMGWPTQLYTGASEREQANFIARAYIDSYSVENIGSMSWYDFRDDGNNPFYNEHRFGTIRNDFTPKPSYIAVSNVIKNFDMAKFVQEIDLGNGIICFEFVKDNKKVIALWSAETEIYNLKISGDFTVADIMGNKINLLPSDDGYLISLTERSPVILKGENIHINDLSLLELNIPDVMPSGGKRMISVDRHYQIKADGLPDGWSLEGKYLKAPKVKAKSIYYISISLYNNRGKISTTRRIDVLPEVIRF